jgi:hypothetical protein
MQHVVKIGDDPVVGDLPARRLHQPLERESIGVEDLPWLPRIAGLGHLVAGGQHRHARALAHQQLGQAQRGGHPQLLGAEHGARGQDDAARAHVLAATPGIDARLDGRDQHAPAAPLDHLLRVHRVGAGGHGRARHDAESLARPDGSGEDGAGGELAHHFEIQPTAGGHARVSHRVAIHGGIVGGRHVDGRAHVLRHHAPQRRGERQDLRRDHPIHLGEHARLGVLHGNQRGGGNHARGESLIRMPHYTRPPDRPAPVL